MIRYIAVVTFLLIVGSVRMSLLTQVPTPLWSCVSQLLFCASRSSPLPQFGGFIFLII
jgi:hypothetical protein